MPSHLRFTLRPACRTAGTGSGAAIWSWCKAAGALMQRSAAACDPACCGSKQPGQLSCGSVTWEGTRIFLQSPAWPVRIQLHQMQMWGNVPPLAYHSPRLTSGTGPIGPPDALALVQPRPRVPYPSGPLNRHQTRLGKTVEIDKRPEGSAELEKPLRPELKNRHEEKELSLGGRGELQDECLSLVGKRSTRS